MRFAIECFGEVRCSKQDKHIEQFIYLFPEIFNEKNEIDFFFLTTKNERGKEINYNENFSYYKNLLGDSLKAFEFVEDQPNIEAEENAIIERWNSVDTKVKLPLDELYKHRDEVISGIELRSSRNLWLGSHYIELDAIDKTINGETIFNLTKNDFVPLLFYRKMLVNNIRKKYQTQNNITYDWIVSARLFDTTYYKHKNLDFLYSLPDKNTVYSLVDHFTIATPELTDEIYEDLGKNYPVVHYEQWFDEQFKREYSKVDIGIYHLRTGSTLCCENQFMWKCLKSCSNCVLLRQDRHKDVQFVSFQICPKRLSS